MTGPRVALVTAAAHAHLDEDLTPITSALLDRGVDVAAIDWHDGDVDWGAFDVAVVRSTWDYTWQLDAFLAWAERVDAQTRLLNPLAVLQWNSDKRYLTALDAYGVPVVPTTVVDPGAAIELDDSVELVVKPVVSAGGRDTERYGVGQVDAARRHVADLHADDRSVLVQPYLHEIDAAGETGLVFLGDQFSHAFRKGPILGPDAVFVEGLYREEDISRREPTASERDVADAALDAVERCVPNVTRRDLLYARVDVAPGEAGPVVLELELVEPSLFCSVAPAAADRFAEVVDAALAGI